MTANIFTLQGHKMWRLYIIYTKIGLSTPKIGLLTPKLTLGDPFPTPLWLDEYCDLASKLKINLEYIIENLFVNKLIKLCSSQYLIICNEIYKRPTFVHMTCIHGHGNNVVDYAISDTQVLNCLVNFDLLNDHEPNSDHIPLSLTLNLDMHTRHIQKNGENQRHIHFDKSKEDLLKYLTRDLGSLTYNDNNDHIYHNFTTTLSTTINKFSTEVSSKNNNRSSNP